MGLLPLLFQHLPKDTWIRIDEVEIEGHLRTHIQTYAYPLNREGQAPLVGLIFDADGDAKLDIEINEEADWYKYPFITVKDFEGWLQ